MADVTFSLQANSNQLNAMDILGCEPVLIIERVEVKYSDQKQPIWIYYHGCGNRPYKPNLGMRRILALAWGGESDGWIGKGIRVFTEPTVVYSGKEMGGIQIRALSGIATKGINTTLAINRTKRVPFKVEYLSMERPVYDPVKFDSTFPAMVSQLESGKMSLEQIVSQCQKTGDLSIEQLKRLEDAAPIEDGE